MKVLRKYQLDVEFTINVQQFLHGIDSLERQNQQSKEKLESQKNITQPKLRSNQKELKFCIVFANFICEWLTDKMQTPSRIFGDAYLTMRESV